MLYEHWACLTFVFREDKIKEKENDWASQKVISDNGVDIRCSAKQCQNFEGFKA